MRYTLIDKLNNTEWDSVSTIVLFGYGRQGKRLYKVLKQNFRVLAIVENDVSKQGIKTEDNVNILSFNDAIPLMKQYKTIVTTAEYHYKQIRNQLKEIGLVENKDFLCISSLFLNGTINIRKRYMF